MCRAQWYAWTPKRGCTQGPPQQGPWGPWMGVENRGYISNSTTPTLVTLWHCYNLLLLPPPPLPGVLMPCFQHYARKVFRELKKNIKILYRNCIFLKKSSASKYHGKKDCTNARTWRHETGKAAIFKGNLDSLCLWAVIAKQQASLGNQDEQAGRLLVIDFLKAQLSPAAFWSKATSHASFRSWTLRLRWVRVQVRKSDNLGPLLSWILSGELSLL